MARANVVNTQVVPELTKVSPYYDDFDETKNFHRILFRPGYPVQSRELTQIQTIMQNQIERFGKHIFENGSAVIGGKIDLTDVTTINIESQYSSTDVDVDDFVNKTIRFNSGNNSVIAKVLDVSDSTANTPKALHVKYITGQEFGPGSVIKVDGANTRATLRSTSNVSANGTLAFIYDSIYFINGYFVKVPTQSVVAAKYSRRANVNIGLELSEDYIDESEDTSLYDPALEASNYQAPGATRYKLELILAARTPDSEDDEAFIQIAKVREGSIIEQVKYPLYSEIEEVLARRTYDESGNYIVKPFVPRIEDAATDSANNFTLHISPGKAYLYGFERENQRETRINIPRARETETKTTYDLNCNFGRYVIVDDVNGNFNISGQGLIDLHCVRPSQVITTNNRTYNSTKVGTARIKDLEFYSNGSDAANTRQRQFELYFYDTNFTTLSGNANSTVAVNQIDLNSSNTSNIANAYTYAYIKITAGPSEGDLRQILSYNGMTKVATVDSNFTTNTTSSSQYTIRYDFSDVDSFIQRYPYTNGATSNASAMINLLSKDATDLDSSNTFVNESTLNFSIFGLPESYVAPGMTGESYVYRRNFGPIQFTSGVSSTLTALSGEEFQGATSSSNTSSTVTDNFLVIVTDVQGSSRALGDQIKVTTSITNSTPEQAILETANTSESFIAVVYAKMQVSGSSAQPRVKTLVLANTQTMTAETPNGPIGGSTGSRTYVYPNSGQVVIMNPSKENLTQESLYITDLIEIKKIYSLSSNTVPSSGFDLTSLTDVTNRYEADNGQRDTHYDHATIRLKSGFAPVPEGLVVCCRYYKATSDSGYYSVDSYPHLANTVVEEGTSIGTGYSLVPSFKNVRLTDAIDFRPIRPNSSNSANYSFASAITPIATTDFTATYDYYLPRKDLIIMSLNNGIERLEGEPGYNQPFPKVPDRSIILHRLSVSPYTLNRNSILIDTEEHRRYTMKDISNIDRRLKNVERSVALNNLEKRAMEIEILDTDGVDRTKYGVLADTFRDDSLMDKTDPDAGKVSYDSKGTYTGDGMLSPRFINKDIRLAVDSNSYSRIAITDDKIMLAYTTEPAITQNVATKSTPVADYLFAGFRGQVIMSPEGDVWKDTTIVPPSVISIPIPYPIVEVRIPDSPPPPEPVIIYYSNTVYSNTTTIITATCLTEDTLIRMGDGTQKKVSEIEIGKTVISAYGNYNGVLGLEQTIVGTRGLVSVNGSKHFATPDHMFKSKGNVWLVADLALAEQTNAKSFNDMKKTAIVRQMKVGDFIDTEEGYVEVQTIDIKGQGIHDTTKLYDLILDEDSDHTYYADGYAVHNCQPPDPPVEYELLMMESADGTWGGFGGLEYDPVTGNWTQNTANTYFNYDESGVASTIGTTYADVANLLNATYERYSINTRVNEDDVREIEELYLTALNRPPDAAGVAYWLMEWKSGMYATESERNYVFFQGANQYASAELDFGTEANLTPDYIRINQFLTRDTGPASGMTGPGTASSGYVGPTGSDYSGVDAGTGTTRDLVYTEVLSDMYRTILDREPDQAGLDYWLEEVQRTGDINSVMSNFWAAAHQNGEAGLAT